MLLQHQKPAQGLLVPITSPEAGCKVRLILC